MYSHTKLLTHICLTIVIISFTVLVKIMDPYEYCHKYVHIQLFIRFTCMILWAFIFFLLAFCEAYCWGRLFKNKHPQHLSLGDLMARTTPFICSDACQLLCCVCMLQSLSSFFSYVNIKTCLINQPESCIWKVGTPPGICWSLTIVVSPDISSSVFHRCFHKHEGVSHE